MDIRSAVSGDWEIEIEGLGQTKVEGKNFFNNPTLGDYARYAYELFTREWVEDTVDPSKMFEFKTADEASHRAVFALKQDAGDFAGEDFGGLKLRRDGLHTKPE